MTVNSRGRLFGLTTSANSNHFTKYLINSFFATTSLKNTDLFVLIDNDNIWNDFSYPRVNVVKNQIPLGFAENVNKLINIADANELDLIMITNDIVLTPNWLQSLEVSDTVITLPSCNQTHTYLNEAGTPVYNTSVDLTEYNNNWNLLCQVANLHSTSARGLYERLLMPFYLFRLPRKIYQVVGLFDEEFGSGGGEDVDYRIRTILAGFKVKYVSQSYVLHFHGKSTWAGGETDIKILERNQKYFNKFTEKWGSDLANLLLVGGNGQLVKEKYNLNLQIDDDYNSLINNLLAMKKQDK
jgi:GT2 family glycosyltransferase